MPRNAGNSAKAGRDQLRDRMRGWGCSVAQIAAEMGRRFNLRPRVAWRHALGLGLPGSRGAYVVVGEWDRRGFDRDEHTLLAQAPENGAALVNGSSQPGPHGHDSGCGPGLSVQEQQCCGFVARPMTIRLPSSGRALAWATRLAAGLTAHGDDFGY